VYKWVVFAVMTQDNAANAYLPLPVASNSTSSQRGLVQIPPDLSADVLVLVEVISF